MNSINVKIKLTRGTSMPKYATDGSAAIDLCAAIGENESITLCPGERVLVPTGIAIAPESKDTVAVVAARSGLASKKGICLSNGIGVIDSDYRGEILVGLQNSGEVDYTVRPGDRIAQMMVTPVIQAQLRLVEELDDTARGEGRFGSTGT